MSEYNIMSNLLSGFIGALVIWLFDKFWPWLMLRRGTKKVEKFLEVDSDGFKAKDGALEVFIASKNHMSLVFARECIFNSENINISDLDKPPHKYVYKCRYNKKLAT